MNPLTILTTSISRNILRNVKCRFVPTSTRNARTGKKNQTLAYGARVEWAEPEYDDEDDG